MSESQFFYCRYRGKWLAHRVCDRFRSDRLRGCCSCKQYQERMKEVMKEAAEKIKEAIGATSAERI